MLSEREGKRVFKVAGSRDRGGDRMLTGRVFVLGFARGKFGFACDEKLG